jgi:tetratricopeptide (TPR) repeat protein
LPNIPNDLVKFLLDDLRRGKFSAVIARSDDLLRRDPNSTMVLNIKGVALQNSNQDALAERCFMSAIKKSPASDYTFCNLGNLNFKKGQFDLAKQNYQEALRLNPNNQQAANNLGTVFKELGELKKAEKFYLMSINIDKNFAEPYYNYGVIQKQLNKLEKAEIAYKNALTIRPQYPKALNNLATLYRDFGNTNEAEKLYKSALEIKPNFKQAFFNLCETFEKKNSITELKALLNSSIHSACLNSEDTKYYEALILFREKKFSECKEACSKVDIKRLSKKRVSGFLHLKAKALESVGQFSAAFITFHEMNQFFKSSTEYNERTKLAYQNKMQFRRSELHEKKFIRKKCHSDVGKNLVFMVGFPRSGTTLLDTILRSHKDIQVLEELPMVSKMEAAVPGKNTIEKLEQMNKGNIQAAQLAYLKEARKHVDFKRSKIVVDKLPLNLAEAALISKIFPRSKFLFVLRHPFDAVLSCFMQNFKLNEAMSNMLELDDIVKIYDNVMDIFYLSVERYSLDIHVVKYEELIEDMKKEVSDILKFMDLKWDKEVLHYQKTALNRDEIRTPSYAQVIQPLYKNATYRWINYSNELEAHKPILEKWITRFGY